VSKQKGPVRMEACTGIVAPSGSRVHGRLLSVSPSIFYVSGKCVPIKPEDPVRWCCAIVTGPLAVQLSEAAHSTYRDHHRDHDHAARWDFSVPSSAEPYTRSEAAEPSRCRQWESA
jgi:hypothetical protein